MSAALEEVVVDADPLDAQHLGKQRTQDRLLRRPRRPMRMRRTKLRLRQRPAVELAVRRQRQPLQHHQRRRHHVVRQLPRQRGPQRRGVQHRARRRHHIADQPLAARAIRPRDHGGLRHARPARSAPPRSRPARSGSRAASPARRRGPETPARRPPATAPGRRSGTSGRPPRRSGRRQTAPPSATPGSDSRAPDPRPRCTARRPHPPAPAQARRPAHRPACSRSDGRSAPRPIDRRRRPSASRRSRPRSVRTGSPAEPAADIWRPGPAAPPAAPRRCRSHAAGWPSCVSAWLPSAWMYSAKACSIDGTKCSVVTPSRRIVSTSRAGSRCAPGAAITSRAPTISGQKNSHTETSKLNGVFCSTTSSPVSR